MDKYILKDVAKAFIDMEFPEFLIKKDVKEPVMNNKGHFECWMKRYLIGGGYLKMTFIYANTSFDYNLTESNYAGDDEKRVHEITIYAPGWLKRVFIDGDDCVEHIKLIVLNDVRKQFDEYDISDRKR